MNFNKIDILILTLALCSVQIIYNMHKVKVNNKLLYASRENDYNMAEKAIFEGADINYKAFTRTPLYNAALNDSIDIAELLIEKKADLNFLGPMGDTPLIAAASAGNIDMVKFLLNKGADVNITYNHANDYLNMDAIKIAEANGYDEIADYIKEYKAKRAKEIADNTPLALVLVDLIEEYEGYKLLKKEVFYESE